MIGYLVLGAVALWLILRASGKSILKRREWRLVSGAIAVAAFAGAAAAGIRSAWGVAIVLLLLGLWFALTTRRPPTAAPSARPQSGRMSIEEARSVLGVSAEAGAEEIQAAYTRLMRAVHPDKGGTTGLAAQLNAARDRLLRS